MRRTGRTIAKNASVLMASQLVTWALTLLLTIFLPRYLGAAAVGDLFFATSIWAIVAIVVTFGMDTLLTKEIARDPAKAPEMFGTTILLRSFLFILGYAALVAYVQILNYPAQTRYVAYIIGFNTLLWQFIGVCQAVLQGLERLEFISIANVIGKVISTTLCLILLFLGQGVYVIAAAGIIATLANLAIQIHFLRRIIPLRARASLRDAGRMLKAGIPYLMSGVFLVIYMQVDIVIIATLVSATVAGWYGAADQLFGTFLFVPTVFIAAVFPALSRLYANEPDSLPRLMRKSFDLLLLIAIPVGLGVIAIGDELVVLLFGPEFAGSGPILALMGVVLILTYQNMLLGQFLISTDRQNAWTVVMAIATVATLPIDLVIIPWCQATFGNGGIGGAVSFIITEFVMVIAGLWLLPRGMLNRANASFAARATVAGIVMAGVAWLLRDQFILIPVVAGALVYAAVILILRVVPNEDIQLFKSLAQSVLGRLRPPAVAVIEGEKL